jgi:serine/threonine protein kinase
VLQHCAEAAVTRSVLTVDFKHSDVVAIKIIRDIKRYRRSAEIEADIMGVVCAAVKKSKEEASSNDSATEDGPLLENRHKFVVKLYSTFYHQGHFCMVQEPLGLSLYEFIKRNKYAGFPLPVVRHIAFQLFSAVSWSTD